MQEQMSSGFCGFSNVNEAALFIEQLQARVATIQAKILKEKNALTPIGKLPEEMLLNVFEHCVEGAAEICDRNKSAPIHLWTAILHTYKQYIVS
ncbi:hypothetical protein SISSUDRAFT_435293 [Sistotremastrum suecicum HHB10207 ss-3]|uniref:Uncharacterized protein n=1 Tax=Sistotremastrum suecicum HHB10207 ss-3 TaxID=1314776 RepID=A0A165YFP4_9AGAM|nr:hypothetical protein SISSUDRAFT_435293 [Sistotremastrum suecicum HHB10207 ss-3]